MRWRRSTTTHTSALNGLAVDLIDVEDDSLVSGNADFSVSIWVNPADFQANDWGTYFFMGEASPGNGFILNESGAGDGRVVPGFYGGNWMGSTDRMVQDQWNHVGFTYDADAVTGRLFVNGVQQYTQNLTETPATFGGFTAMNILSGASALGAIGGPNPIQPFNGGVDEFAFFQKTLADDDMRRLSDREGKLPPPPPPPPPPVAYNADAYAATVKGLQPSLYYRLNETTVGVVTDSSGNNRNASHVPDLAQSELNLVPGALNPDSAIHSQGMRVDLVDVEEAGLVEGSADFSVSIWVKPEAFGGWGTYFFMGEAGLGRGFILNESGNGDGHVVPGVYGGNFGESVNSLVLNDWNHVGFTYDADSTTAKLFLNGNLESTTVLLDTPTVPGGYTELNIGTGASALGAIGGANPIQPFIGGIDEFAFFQTTLTDEQMLSLAVRKVMGDFNLNGVYDVEDIDLLSAQSASNQNLKAYDLNNDNLVNGDDVTVWVKDLADTWIGDANYDREFNSADFVDVFIKGKYELNVAAVWSEGDWNGDGRFDSGDFVASFVDGGYEQGLPTAAVSAVPEPSAWILMLLAALACLGRRRQA